MKKVEAFVKSHKLAGVAMALQKMKSFSRNEALNALALRETPEIQSTLRLHGEKRRDPSGLEVLFLLFPLC